MVRNDIEFSLLVELEDGAFPHYYKRKIQSMGVVDLHTLESMVDILKCNFHMPERVNALQDISHQKLETAAIAPLRSYSKELNDLSAKHLAEAGKTAKPETAERFKAGNKMVKSETTERMPPSIEKKARPLFALDHLKKMLNQKNLIDHS